MPNSNMQSAVLAGVIAFVAYLVISLLTDAAFGSALLGAVVLGVVTFAGTLLIIRLIVARRSPR